MPPLTRAMEARHLLPQSSPPRSMPRHKDGSSDFTISRSPSPPFLSRWIYAIPVTLPIAISSPSNPQRPRPDCLALWQRPNSGRPDSLVNVSAAYHKLTTWRFRACLGTLEHLTLSEIFPRNARAVGEAPEPVLDRMNPYFVSANVRGEGVRLNCCSILPMVARDGRMMTPDGHASGSRLLIEPIPTDSESIMRGAISMSR